MYEEQKTITVDLTNRIRTIYDMKRDGYRLVAITCTKVPEGFEVSYSFDKDYSFVSVRIVIPPEQELTSISGVYYPAFIYENELKDLFGVKIKHINIDYQGSFYKLAQKTPFNPPAEGDAEPVAAKEDK